MLYLQRNNIGGIMLKERDIKTLLSCKLFTEITAMEFKTMSPCIAPISRFYKKGEYIFRQGDHVNSLGVIISGQVVLERIDYWGNRTLQTKLHESDVFGEAYACLPKVQLIMDVVAVTDVHIVFINIQKIMDTCKNMCVYHKQLSRNLLDILVHKNILLNEKAVHLSQRSIRNKITSYLSEQSKMNNEDEFSINLDRQGLADYLCVDRSALSSELSKLKKEGLIDFRKNKFKLLSIKDDIV